MVFNDKDGIGYVSFKDIVVFIVGKMGIVEVF